MRKNSLSLLGIGENLALEYLEEFSAKRACAENFDEYEKGASEKSKIKF
ncbi:unnamed protein product [Ceratitis capitata]|uniref:(Mediterranean fruit fly) hypothetical protein n=1 Tax=Ceratitis capitata TaxID=7213 RepID=A0A811TZJ6_CERCA|nr:unnamed protein product [Ceratitis capitata]